MFCFIIETSNKDYIFILILIGCIVGLESCKFCVFSEEIIVCNDSFKLEYKSERGHYCDTLLSIKIDAATCTPASTINFDAIGIGFNLFDVLSPTTITAIAMENEKEAAPQPRIQTSHLADKSFNFDPTDAGSGAFDDLEYIFAGLLSEDGFTCDINNVFKNFNIYLIFFFLQMHHVAYEFVLFLGFDIEFAIEQAKVRSQKNQKRTLLLCELY